MYHKWCSFIKVHTYSQNAISEVPQGGDSVLKS